MNSKTLLRKFEFKLSLKCRGPEDQEAPAGEGGLLVEVGERRGGFGGAVAVLGGESVLRVGLGQGVRRLGAVELEGQAVCQEARG